MPDHVQPSSAAKDRVERLIARSTYLRWRAEAQIRPPLIGDRRLPKRFWRKVEPFHTGCWLWTAGINRDGYSEFRWSKRYGSRRSHGHRVAYEALVGELPACLVIDHLCRVRCCVNPMHMEPVLMAENSARSPVEMARRFAGYLAQVCGRGHEMTPENTRSDSGCRECHRVSTMRRRKQKRDEAVLAE